MASIIERKGANGKPTYFVRIRKRGYRPVVGSSKALMRLFRGKPDSKILG